MNTATVVPMTKERAAEIFYAFLRLSLQNGVAEKGALRMTKDLQDVFCGTNISNDEILAFVEFVKTDINQALEQK